MPYNLKLETAQEVLEQLQQLNGSVVEFKSANPQRLAFHLRQGCAAAKANGLQVPRWDYRFVVGRGSVVGLPLTQRAAGVKAEIKTVLQLLRFLMVAPAPVDSVLFPNLSPLEEELTGLNTWLGKRGMVAELTDVGLVVRRLK